MNVVIIEDEEFAARRLERMIKEIDPDIQVVAKLESVAESVEWFKNHNVPDLIFMDIHLEDNLSFAIFDSISISCPIVFTTATDELSTRAFKLKEIDFLLKPIIQTELVKMIEKYHDLPVGERKILNAALFDDIVKKPESSSEHGAESMGHWTTNRKLGNDKRNLISSCCKPDVCTNLNLGI